MQIDPRHLEILAAIVDAGGVSEGARILDKPQPSLSRTVSALEARLGMALFEKGRRPLQPTELCLRLAAEGRLVSRATSAAQTIATRFSAGQAGSIRVAGTPIFMDGVVSSVIAGFQGSHPEIRIDQSYGYADELTSALLSRTIDLAICPIEKQNVPEGIACQPILKGRNVITCSVTHPLARKKSQQIEDIREYPWITQPAGSPLFQDLKDVLQSIGVVDFKVSYSGGTLSSIINVLLGSNALTVLPFSVVYMQPPGTIGALPIRIKHPKRELCLLWQEEIGASIAVKRLIRYLTRQFDSIAAAITERQRREIWQA